MIQPTELRIGNYLTYHTPDDTDMPCKIDAQDILNISTNYMHNAEIHSPIPLTEEILLKCDWGGYKPMHFNSYFEIDVKGCIWYCGDFTGIVIKHLHQLQNLYWCLCGKELEVNL